jgi:hypothetical protein
MGGPDGLQAGRQAGELYQASAAASTATEHIQVNQHLPYIPRLTATSKYVVSNELHDIQLVTEALLMAV